MTFFFLFSLPLTDGNLGTLVYPPEWVLPLSFQVHWNPSAQSPFKATKWSLPLGVGKEVGPTSSSVSVFLYHSPAFELWAEPFDYRKSTLHSVWDCLGKKSPPLWLGNGLPFWPKEGKANLKEYKRQDWRWKRAFYSYLLGLANIPESHSKFYRPRPHQTTPSWTITSLRGASPLYSWSCRNLLPFFPSLLRVTMKRRELHFKFSECLHFSRINPFHPGSGEWAAALPLTTLSLVWLCRE